MSSIHVALRVVFILLAATLFSFLTMLSARAGQDVPKTVAEDPSIPHINLNGVVFHSETFGDPSKPVVIVVHGGPGWDYRGLLALKTLSDEYFVVFYDQRGTGLSPRVDGRELTLETSISDLDAIVEHYSKGNKARLIGHSWGAMLASAYISRHPEKVSHAVLAEPGFLTTEMMKKSGIKYGPRWEADFLWRASKAWIRSLFINGPGKDAGSDFLIGQVAPYANPGYYCDEVLPESARTYWRPGSTAMQAIMKSAANNKGEIEVDLVKGIEKFDRTVLFMAGECNAFIGEEYQKEQMKLFPKAELVVVKKSGHMIFAEQPDESIGAVRLYFAR